MSSERASRVRYLILVWFCALAALAYIHRNCITVPAERIAAEIGLSDEQMGLVLGMFFWGYGAMQIPGGWVGWRFGSRLVVPALVLLWSGANSLMALALGFWFLVSCRFVMGMAQAALFPCAVQSFARWFPPTERAMPSGYLAAFMSVGAALATALTGFLLQYVDWQTLMVLYGLPAAGVAAWFYVSFRDTPREHPSVNAGELSVIEAGPTPVATLEARSQSWSRLLLAPEMLLLCAQQFCRAAAYIFYATWWPTYLQQAHGLSEEESGYLGSLPLLGVVVGSALGGQVMDWIYQRTGSIGWSRRGMAAGCLLLSAALMVAGVSSAEVWLTVLALTSSSVFAGACGPASYTFTIDYGRGRVATVFSVMNMSGNIGAAILPSAVVPLQRAHGWDSVLWLLGALYLAAALCWLTMRMPRTQA